MLTIKKRPCELGDFVKMKKRFPTNFLRTVAKHVGLGLVFYCQFRTLATMLREGGLTESDLDIIIKTLSLEDEYDRARREFEARGPEDTTKPTKRDFSMMAKDIIDVKFLVVAKRLHALFYEAYPGLRERCEREHVAAMSMAFDPVTKKRRPRGYMRSWGGPIRHLPELRYMNFNSNGQLLGADRLLYSAMFSELKNQASNSSIQTLEVYHTAPVISCASHNFKRNGMKSRIWNFVHDSQDLYVHKSEVGVILAMFEEMMKAYDESGHGIPMEMEGSVSDVTGGMRGYGKGQHMYHSGEEQVLKGRSLGDEAAKAGMVGFEFEDTIPR